MKSTCSPLFNKLAVGGSYRPICLAKSLLSLSSRELFMSSIISLKLGLPSRVSGISKSNSFRHLFLKCFSFSAAGQPLLPKHTGRVQQQHGYGHSENIVTTPCSNGNYWVDYFVKCNER